MERSTQKLDEFRSQQELLLNELGLIAGMPITLVKVAEEDPNLPQTETISGHLDRLGQFGYAITVNNEESVTSPLTQIDVHNNRTYLRCGTSIYEIISKITPSENAPESTEKRKPKSITTSKGSVYTYLPDGRTQRYKLVEKDLKEPQNVLVFIPKIEDLKEWAHYNRLPEWMKEYPSEEVMEILASDYVQSSDHKVVLGDGAGNTIKSNEEAARAGELLLYFTDSSGKAEFALPVSSDPTLGTTTFDAQFFKNENGDGRYKCHIGNKVVSIEYE